MIRIGRGSTGISLQERLRQPHYGEVMDGADTLLVDVGALMIPGRYRRIRSAAERLGWDPAVLLDAAVGALVLPPESGVAQHPDPTAARARADRGAATWPEAMGELAAAIDASTGPAWDEQAYWSALMQEPVSVDLTASLALLARSPGPVGLLATGPEEFAAGIEARLPDLAHPVWHTCRLGMGKPDAWDAVLAGIGRDAVAPSSVLVIDDAWGSQEQMRARGFRTLWLSDDAACHEAAALIEAWCSSHPR